MKNARSRLSVAARGTFWHDLPSALSYIIPQFCTPIGGQSSKPIDSYGERAKDRPEVFAQGALSWPDGGVILNEQHNRQAPILRFVPKVEGREVRIDAPLPDTQRGRDAATMVRNGTMTGLSVEFAADDEGMRGGVREIRKACLLGAGLVDDPSHVTTVEVRAGAGGRRRRLWL